jgi:ATP-dependent RNA helicase RhlE
MMPFSSLGLSPALLQALARQQYTQPYPIQQQAIPAIINNHDVLGIAPTGSGKTASYVLPIIMQLQHAIHTKNRHVQVLVLVPTRELAIQVKEVFQLFCLAMPQPIKPMAVYGGVSINPQMINLQGVDILIATPGRLLELVANKAVHLSDVKTLVLDEADKMLNLGFKQEMNQIVDLLPKVRQNLLYSATLSPDLETINKGLLHRPLVINITTEPDNIDLISQSAYRVTTDKKGPLLRFLIKEQQLNQVLVFTSSVYQADNVADKLRKNGITAESMHSKKSQGARTETLQQFKSKKIQVLVATDLIARGIDIPNLPCVLNYELPRSPIDYVHRIGRTGRAETPGNAISLVSPEEEHHFGVIQKKMGKHITLMDSESLL